MAFDGEGIQSVAVDAFYGQPLTPHSAFGDDCAKSICGPLGIQLICATFGD